ncbi:MAG: glycoside hydrolase family 3 C-terminal domain-containing protein [Planctomycetes bacterium]|nr:glycoside hydrolase family 3 C-terminal domain-containing protein [Planctomycetota bacterium]
MLFGLALAAAAAGCRAPSEAPDRARIPSRSLASFDGRVDELMARMRLEEKIGQMIQADQEFLADPTDIETLFLGSILSGGNSDPPDNSFEAWRAMVEGVQSHALRTRLGIPLLYGVDAVHGHSNVEGACLFPHNIGLGCARNPELAREIARITAIEVKATGIQWTFAPCVAVPRDIRWGRTYEGFSEDPEIVRVLSKETVRGFQGDDLSDPLAVVACAKHYVGDGGTVWGTGMPKGENDRYPLDRGDMRVDEKTLRAIHLPGYVAAIRAGVGTIMPSYSSWNGEKLSAHEYLLTDLLKGELGFEGFLISDYDAIDALPGDYRAQIKASVNAGMDMFMVPKKYRQLFEILKSLAQAGEVPMARIDDAVRRILRVKFAAGLFDRSPMADRDLAVAFGSAAHRQVARDAVRQSLVLLENGAGLLPLSKRARRIHVAGAAADDLGIQCGGWTIDWQGKLGRPTKGTTILEAVRKAVSADTEVTFSADASGAAGADAAIVVIGEKPYAEFFGDREDLALPEADVALVRAVKAAGMPIVLILLSGRPLILSEILDDIDALIAAWLPGTEGDGVADVLFGDFPPAGRLSFTWPKEMDQIPIHAGDEDYDPLFPLGFGLTYDRR